MKRFLIALILFFAIIFLIVVLIIQVNEIESITEKMTEHIIELIDRSDPSSPKEIDKFVSYWMDKESFLLVFVRHEHLDQVTTTVVSLPALYEESPLLCKATLLEIKQAVEHLKESEFPLPE